jgi:hypothetical protein
MQLRQLTLFALLAAIVSAAPHQLEKKAVVAIKEGGEGNQFQTKKIIPVTKILSSSNPSECASSSSPASVAKTSGGVSTCSEGEFGRDACSVFFGQSG